MSSLSTHVLDAVRGEPAAGVQVELSSSTDDGWVTIGSGVTDADGRITDLAPGEIIPGVYRLVFATGTYFRTSGTVGFYPEVVISFEVDEERHYHVPLLLSPYAFSTYRGS
ncbi:MAG: hydroxyisourate hydrolase [Propionibacteriaceae bacterium]